MAVLRLRAVRRVPWYFVADRFSFALPDPRPRHGWFRVGNLDITTTALLVIAGVASMFLYAISTVLFSKLVFAPDLVRGGEIWRVATWPIANPPTRIWVVITLFFFWIFGHYVEEMVGRNRYALLIAITAIVPAIFVSLIGSFQASTVPAAGLGLLGSAMLVIYAAQYPSTPFFFGIPAWVVAAVFVGIDVLQYTGNRYWGTLTLMLVAISCALVVVRQWGFVDRLSFIPQFVGTGSSRRSVPKTKKKRRGSGATVVDGPWVSTTTTTIPRPPSPDAVAAQHELDELLDKISAEGIDSLTTDEKRRLNDLSKRLR